MKAILDSKIKEALLGHDEVAKNIFRLAKSEILAAEMRLNEELSEEQKAKILRKLVQSNKEMIVALKDESRIKILERENELLSELLPKNLTVAEISTYLESQQDDENSPLSQILAAKGDGQATGIAMKVLKTAKQPVEGGDVAEAVKKLREYWSGVEGRIQQHQEKSNF